MTGPTRSGAGVLIVDDEPAIRSSLERNLVGHGFSVWTAEDGETGLELEARVHPDLVLLDLGLPQMDGFEVIARIRKRSNTPIIVLSVRGAEREKVRALDLGADDYLTKPFGVAELLARLRVALRHAGSTQGGSEPTFRSADLTVDLERRSVSVGGQEVHLTPTEYALLTALIARPGRVLTARMLLQRVWGPEYGSESHYLHVYMARLRKKLERRPDAPHVLQTEPGVGYRLLELEPTD